jgi:uncharacterized membrane protein
MLRRTLLALAAAALALTSAVTNGAEPAARAVLFYSPECPHCHTVMTESLPPLLARYGDQLQVAAVDVTTPEGQELYQAMVQRFQVPDERLGVPALVIGESVLVGSIEIPERLPALADAALARGGLPWPDIPGLAAQLEPPPTADTVSASRPLPADVPAESAPSAAPPLLRDMPANALALVLLAAMVAAVAWAVRAWRHPRVGAARWRDLTVPALALAGLAIASYLTLVETALAPAVCGPVGNCAAVQQSAYASILGVPVGALGMTAYAALLLAWAAEHLLRGRRAKLAGLALAGLAGAGTLFSIYLTFLEPFVIGATCMWCLTSAALMTALLWLAAPYHGLLAAPRREQVARGKRLRRP